MTAFVKKTAALPVAAPFDLGALSKAGAVVALAPKEAERTALAKFLGIDKLESLRAGVTLERAGDSFTYRADLSADIVQSCVVTLEPIKSHIARDVARRYQLTPKIGRKVKIEDVSPIEDDEPEMIGDPVIDLYGPLLEELALAIDPYPRAPGAAFAVPESPEDVPESPFAILGKLKEPKR